MVKDSGQGRRSRRWCRSSPCERCCRPLLHFDAPNDSTLCRIPIAPPPVYKSGTTRKCSTSCYAKRVFFWTVEREVNSLIIAHSPAPPAPNSRPEARSRGNGVGCAGRCVLPPKDEECGPRCFLESSGSKKKKNDLFPLCHLPQAPNSFRTVSFGFRNHIIDKWPEGRCIVHPPAGSKAWPFADPQGTARAPLGRLSGWNVTPTFGMLCAGQRSWPAGRHCSTNCHCFLGVLGSRIPAPSIFEANNFLCLPGTIR